MYSFCCMSRAIFTMSEFYRPRLFTWRKSVPFCRDPASSKRDPGQPGRDEKRPGSI